MLREEAVITKGCTGLILVLVAQLMTCSLVYAGDRSSSGPASPEGWITVATPSDDAIWCANRSRESWRLELTNAGVLIKRQDESDLRRDDLPFAFSYEQETPERRARRVVLKTDTEWLVGIDQGTYGGGLWVFDSQGQHSRRLWDENVRELIQLGDQVFALAGQPLLDRGVVVEVTHGSNGLRAAKEITRLAGYPYVALVDDDSLLVITGQGLSRVSRDGLAKPELKLPLRSLYPTSMVRAEQRTFYVGMRHFLLQLRQTPKGFEQQWFGPQDCASFKVTRTAEADNERCVCSASVRHADSQ